MEAGPAGRPGTTLVGAGADVTVGRAGWGARQIEPEARRDADSSRKRDDYKRQARRADGHGECRHERDDGRRRGDVPRGDDERGDRVGWRGGRCGLFIGGRGTCPRAGGASGPRPCGWRG